MKRSFKHIWVPLLLVSVLFCCGTAQAKTAEKGFLVRWWERVTRSEVQNPKPPVSEPVSEKPVLPPKDIPAQAVKETEIEKKQSELTETEITGSVEEIMPAAKEEKKVSDINSKLTANDAVIKGIEAELKRNPELMETIPNLYEKLSVKDKRSYYYYAPQGEAARRLIRLDSETLNGLRKKIDEEKVKIKKRTEIPPRAPAMLIPKDSKVPVVEAPGDVEEAEMSEDATTESGEEPEREEIPLDKDEMLERIEKRLKIYSEIIYIIPGLSFTETDSGDRKYFYTGEGGEALPLDALDKETLYNLFSRINNEATRINTERLVRQLQQLEQIRRSSQNIPQPPPQPMAPPQVFIPPQPPPMPPQPPRIPTPPAPPAQPPRR